MSPESADPRDASRSERPVPLRRFRLAVRVEVSVVVLAVCLAVFVLIAYADGQRCTDETSGGSVAFFLAAYGAMAAAVLGGVLLLVAAVLAVRSPTPGLGRLVATTVGATAGAVAVFAVFTVECFAPGGLGV